MAKQYVVAVKRKRTAKFYSFPSVKKRSSFISALKKKNKKVEYAVTTMK